MNRFATSLLPTALFLLVLASSLALIAAAWLMTTFCLNALSRFTLPFGLALWVSTASVIAQTKTPDDYVVVYERTTQAQTTLSQPIQAAADTSQPDQTMKSRKYRRKINPVPLWPDETSPDRSPADPPGIQLFLIVPILHPGSPEVKGLYSIAIRGTH